LIGFNHGEAAGEISLRERGTPGPIGDAKAGSYNQSNEAKYQGYLLAEFTYPILPAHEGGAQWFYSLPKYDHLCLPAEGIYADYLGAAKYGNIFSIDAGPDYNGKLRAIDVETLTTVGKYIRGEIQPPKTQASDSNSNQPAIHSGEQQA
jgi:alpha-L-fucosidase